MCKHALRKGYLCIIEHMPPSPSWQPILSPNHSLWDQLVHTSMAVPLSATTGIGRWGEGKINSHHLPHIFFPIFLPLFAPSVCTV